MVDALRMSPETAQAYKILCDFGSLFIRENPSPESINNLIDRRDMLREEPFSVVAPEASLLLCGILAAAEKSGREAFIAEVRQNYTYLFYMVGASHTSPFESVYRTDDRTMFGPSTLRVRTAYREWGVQLAEQGSMPDDHLGYELAFLANLLERVGGQEKEDFQSEERGQQALQALEAASCFLSDHTLVFAPIYLKNIQTRSQEPFYAAVSGIVQALLASLALCLNAVPTEQINESEYLLEK